jgi:hypothetical protein
MKNLALLRPLLVLTLALAPGTAAAGPRDDLTEAVRAFDEAALRLGDDNSQPTGVVKWTGPLRVAVRYGSRAPGLVQPSLAAVRVIAETAGLAVTDVDIADTNPATGANFVIFFDENALKNNCIAFPRYEKWALVRAEIQINHAYRGSLDNCVIHEAMHAFGFMSHPHAADSVLSYVYQRPKLTTLDVNLIKTLYDPAMKIGTTPRKASALACGLLARSMSIGDGDRDAVCGDWKSTVQFPPEPERRKAELVRAGGDESRCVARATYRIVLYPNAVAFSYSDGWHTFNAEADRGFGGTFTNTKNGSTYRLTGSLKTRTVKVENVSSGCVWEGPL